MLFADGSVCIARPTDSRARPLPRGKRRQRAGGDAQACRGCSGRTEGRGEGRVEGKGSGG